MTNEQFKKAKWLKTEIKSAKHEVQRRQLDVDMGGRYVQSAAFSEEEKANELERDKEYVIHSQQRLKLLEERFAAL